MFKKLLNFMEHDIWRFRGALLRGKQGLGLHSLRIFILSFREFASDKCSLRASALTFYTLLSIVPVFAMAFGVAKGFGLEKILKEKLIENSQGQQGVVMNIIQFSENLLQNTHIGIIAGIGLILLFWSVIQVLTNIENSFNDIWAIKKPRSMGQKFSNYLALMLIAPVFFVTASSATVFIVSQVRRVAGEVRMLEFLGPALLIVLQLLPFAVFWGLLTYLYMFLPNGKIQFKSALLGGFVAGVVYQAVQWAYIYFQIGASNAGAVYGTFAALPLFLIWLQTSWLIVLYGAELSFAHQNETMFEYEPDCLNASEEFKKLLALRVAQVCVNRFATGLAPLSSEEIAAQLEMPLRLTNDLLDRLTKANLLNIVQGDDERTRHYQPARDIGDMTLQFVVREMEKAGTKDIPVAQTPELENLRASLNAFDDVLRNLPENALLKDSSVFPAKILQKPELAVS
jgi:membrane protein